MFWAAFFFKLLETDVIEWLIKLLLSSLARNKTPPPVPPRSASKPFISVTVQSSTESAQDTYLEQRSEANSQSGRSNSSDSATSSRTGSLAKAPLPLIPHIPVPIPLVPPIPVPVPSARVSSPPPPPARETQTVSVGFTQDEPRCTARRKLSSIGVQVRLPESLSFIKYIRVRVNMQKSNEKHRAVWPLYIHCPL